MGKNKKDELKDEGAQYSSIHVEKTPERAKYKAKIDRKKYDDVSKRKEYKNEQFGDKKTIKDPYTGETLHKDVKAAKNKYGKNKYNKHTSQTDHTVPIQEIADKNRDNVFLKEEDIKQIANIKENYKEINGNLNQSKGSKSNIETAKKNNVSKQQKKKMTKEQIKATAAVEGETVKLTAKRANEVGMNAAKTGAAVGAAVSAAQNIKAVIDGNEDVTEATLNIAVDAAKSGASSYGMAVATKGAEGALKKAGHKIGEKTVGKSLEKVGEKACSNLVKFAESNELGKAVVVTLEVGKSVKKYLDGELTKGELVLELGEKGTALATSFAMGVPGAAVGTAVGGVVGGLIGSVIPVVGNIGGAAIGAKVGAVVGEIVGNMVGYMIGSEVYKAVKEYYEKFDPGKAEREMKKYAALANQIESYRTDLERNFKEIRMKNNEMVLGAFSSIKEGIINNDVDLITVSLGKICNLYGEDVMFKTNEEFLDFWNDSELVMEL